MADYDSRPETYEHIHQVQRLLTLVLVDLQERLVLHDRSKLSDPEKVAFDEVSPALRKTTYGSDEYKTNLAKIRPALDHHFAHNAHHPEHHEDGIAGMDLLDLLEMVCDWIAAGMRHDDGSVTRPSERSRVDFDRSAAINQERFGYSDELASILRNTARTLGY